MRGFDTRAARSVVSVCQSVRLHWAHATRVDCAKTAEPFASRVGAQEALY